MNEAVFFIVGFIMGFAWCCVILNRNKWPDLRRKADKSVS